MKHDEDGGELTMFGGRNSILIACNKGHCWEMKAERTNVSEGGVDRAASMDGLREQFGDLVFEALGVVE